MLERETSMRLHFLIFAALQRVPSVALPYSGKVQEFLRDLEIESHSGNVEAHLPAGLVADFSLESFSGSIDNGFGPPARRADRWGPGVSVEFSTGSDGADVAIETFSGNIVLKSF